MRGRLHELLNEISHWVPRAGVALLVFSLFWLAGLLLQKLTRRIGEKANVRSDVLVLIGRTASTLLVILGGITALGTAGVNVSALVAGLGLTGFALGFALRDALSNLLAGVLILIYRPFKRHDRISVAGFEGIVIETDLRYTTLQGENQKILIPNSTLFTHSIILLEAKK
ncbi:MAG: mechanosensitive ion channel [Candidatus Manganitrophaceae bacterium]|nr:MAG: mechanosensitive ion channel [Candidatus Manganitrophaceae bacterium]